MNIKYEIPEDTILDTVKMIDDCENIDQMTNKLKYFIEETVKKVKIIITNYNYNIADDGDQARFDVAFCCACHIVEQKKKRTETFNKPTFHISTGLDDVGYIVNTEEDGTLTIDICDDNALHETLFQMTIGNFKAFEQRKNIIPFLCCEWC